MLYGPGPALCGIITSREIFGVYESNVGVLPSIIILLSSFILLTLYARGARMRIIENYVKEKILYFMLRLVYITRKDWRPKNYSF